MKQKAMKILSLLNEAYPDAGTMLHFNTEFECLVAVILSAQSTDEQVNKVTAKLFQDLNRPQDFADIELPLLEERIKGVGLYKNKARHIQAMSKILLEEYDGQVPDDFNELLKLPGVGRKTANVMMSVAFDRPGLGVDTHVQRVANRIGLVQSDKTEQTEAGLKRIIPENWWSRAHHLLIFHGRRVCKARNPACSSCSIESFCEKNIEIKK